MIFSDLQLVVNDEGKMIMDKASPALLSDYLASAYYDERFEFVDVEFDTDTQAAEFNVQIANLYQPEHIPENISQIEGFAGGVHVSSPTMHLIVAQATMLLACLGLKKTKLELGTIIEMSRKTQNNRGIFRSVFPFTMRLKKKKKIADKVIFSVVFNADNGAVTGEVIGMLPLQSQNQ